MATKQFIGSGKQAPFNSVRVSIRLEDAQRHLRMTHSGTWLNFFLAPRKEIDQYGRTHNAFVLVDAAPATHQVAEPGTPVGTIVQKNGRKLKRVSKAEAAARRAAQADIAASAVAEPLELFDGNELD